MNRTTKRLGDAAEPTILTCTENHGLVDQIEHMGRRLATDDLSAYKLVKPLDIVYNVYLLWLGAIGQNLTGSVGVTSPVYEVFTPTSIVYAPYLGMLLRSPEMRERYGMISIGTVPRRRRAPWEQVLEIEVELPPLPEQRRIVDLIGALDEAIEAAHESISACAASLDSILDAHVSDESIALEDLASVKSGASWGAVDGSSRPTEGFRPVLTIVNTRPGGGIELTERTYVRGLSDRAATITSHSLVMIRTNGNRGRIGNIYRTPSEVIGDSVSAFQFVIEPNEGLLRDYLYWVLRAPVRQEAISSAASGSTGLGNIAAGWLKEVSIPWTEPDQRAAFVELCNAAGSVVESAVDFATALRDLRQNLLAALLSGEHEIPSSYDEHLGVVAS